MKPKPKKEVIRRHAYHDTRNSNIKVKINYTAHPDGSIRLAGYAVDARTLIRIDGSRTLKQTARSERDLPQRETYLINNILSRLAPTGSRTSTRRQTDVSGRMADAFDLLTRSHDSIDPGWSDSTRKQYMSIFRNKLLPFLCRFDASGFVESDRSELEQKLLDDILQSKKGKGKFSTAQTTLHNQMRAANIIYNRMRDFDAALPQITLYDGTRPVRAAPESAKSLPREVRSRLVLSVPAIIHNDPAYAQALILMLCGGLRDAEACAVTAESMDFSMDDYALVLVCAQIRDGVRTDILKTANSYRIVVLPWWARVMLLRCLARYREKTGTENVPPLLSVSSFSARTRQLLLDCGCGEDYFGAAQQLIDLNPETPVDMVRMSVVSYVLRHDYASRAKNICGLSNNEIDALLGHKRSAENRRNGIDLANPDDQRSIAARLERFIYDPAISKNPACDPISLHANERVPLIQYNAYRFRNSSHEPVIVDMDVCAAEPGEQIRLRMNADRDISITSHRRPFLPESRCIIGNGLLTTNMEGELP